MPMSEPDRPTGPGTESSGVSRAASSPTFRRVLVPLDGSRLAEASLPLAFRLAEACDATLVLLHVIEKGAPARIHGERHLTSSQEAEAYLTEVARQLAVGGRTVELHTHEVPVGDVAASVASHAEEHAVDLTILCTHGEGGIREALWGSIAQQVLQRSTRPVLLVRARADDRPSEFMPRTIMVPLDATAAAEAALGPAIVLARCLGSQLRLVMVVATSETVAGERLLAATFLPGTTRALLEVQDEQATAYLERLAASIRSAGVPATAEVRRGDTVAQLATDTGEHADGLVVVATHGRAGLQAIWSASVAARLLKRTRAPILLVPAIEPA
jgi:nucleotide-binding universal stress UspA family protein